MVARPGSEARLRSTIGTEPYAFYDQLLEGGGVAWDPDMNAWLVGTFEGAREILVREDDAFHHFYRYSDDEALHAIEGTGAFTLLHGEEHDRHHRFWMNVFRSSAAERWRTDLVRPVVAAQLDLLIGRTHADLVDDVADRVPIRIIAAIMGLPWDDDGWIAETKACMEAKTGFLDHVGNDPDGTYGRAALDGLTRFHELVQPAVEARRDGEGQDLISLMWRHGPELSPVWNDATMASNVFGMFYAGSDTTTHAIANALYQALTEPDLRAVVATGDAKVRSRYVEESLRLYGTVHFRPRMAVVDAELSGVPVQASQLAVSVTAAANRDGAKFACPHAVDLDRPQPRSHLAFGAGPRQCVGATLARVEMEEAVGAVFDRIPDVELDPEAPPPAFSGFLFRSFRPLNVRFSSVLPAGGA